MSLIYRGQIAQESATAPTLDSGIKARFLGRQFTVRQSTMKRQDRHYPLQFMGKTY